VDGGELVRLADGAFLWTSSSGGGSGVVFLHGGPGLSSNLFPVSAWLEDVADCHHYDQRGSGRSSKTPPYDVATFVADLDELGGHWRHERMALVGHSWGAMLALLFALSRPGRVSAIVGIGFPGIDDSWVRVERRWPVERLTSEERERFVSLDGRRGLDEAEGAELARLYWTMEIASRDRLPDWAREPLYGFPMAGDVASAVRRDVGRLIAEGPDAPPSWFRDLAVPALFVHGAEDFRSPDGARAVAEAMPGGRFVELAGAGHCPWIERPDELRSLIRGFLEPVLAS
jgi:proline iminopeptidase